jgi:S-adenosyl methyltransferase
VTDQASAAYPGLIYAVRANRAFLARAVRYLAAEAGIRQFLDIGTGLPTENNTHEVAQAVAPDCRIVYADNDPMVLARACALLSSTPQGACAYLDADLRDPGTILGQAARTLDFGQPVAIMLLGILQLIPDADDPYRIVTELLNAVPPGSYLAISHPASDVAGQLVDGARALRTRDEIAGFFGGLDLVPPGLVPVADWRPAEPASGPQHGTRWAGVGRKR